MAQLLKYLENKAKINLYIEEELLFDENSMKFSENVFFVKGKGDLLLGLINLIERETNIPVINSYKGNNLAINRFLNSMILEKGGIPIPEFSLNPENIEPPFENYIIKNIIDQKNYRFIPKIEKNEDSIHVADSRALKEARNIKENYHYLYYQKFIESKWEYKVYGIGDRLHFYKQLPVLVDPDKMKSRHKIDPIAELEEYSFKAMELLDLRITSIDFLKSKERHFYLTDINCTPNFNYMKKGPQMVGDYLIKQAKR
jgi:glutathione synthase/RimK-type ligase-like ATP-grasp enzyme